MIFPRLQGKNRTLAQLVALVVTLTFTTIVVIPPFYDWFCRVTGFGGATPFPCATSASSCRWRSGSPSPIV